MARTVSQQEGTPAGRIDDVWAWERLERWVTHRWAERGVTWIVEGPGPWVPPLQPVTISMASRWTSGTWQPVTLEETPLSGYCLADGCTYRFEGVAGDDSTPPASVAEALRRLIDYSAAAEANAPYTSVREEVGDVGLSVEMPSLNFARALQQSGAADLLRPWRRPR